MSVNKVVSIEITDASSKIAFKSYGKPVPTLYKTVFFENTENLVVDGYVMDRAAFGQNLKQKLKEAHISCTNLVFVLAGNKIVSREITVPRMKAKLLQGYIESNRGELFPVDTENFVFTYTILEDLKDEERQRVMVYAAPGDLIANYETLASEMGYSVVAIDYTGNAIYQWLKAHEGPNDLYLQINERNSIMTIMNDGKLALQRNMNFGAINLSSKFADFEKYKNYGLSEALKTLKEKPVLYPDFTYRESENDDMKLSDEVTAAVRPLIQQLTQVLEYYGTKNRDVEINRVYLGGCGAEIQNFVELLKSEFQGVDFVLRLKPNDVKIASGCNLTENEVSEYIGAIGASQLSINFSNMQAKRDMNRVVRLCVTAFVLVLVSSGIMVFSAYTDYKSAQEKQKEYQNRLQELQATGVEQLEIAAYQSEKKLAEFKNINDATFSHNENWNAILEELEKVLVQGTVVGSLSASDTGVSMNMEIQAVSVNGVLMDGEIDAKLKCAMIIQNLKTIKYFKNVTVNSINVGEDVVISGDTKYVTTVVSFAVFCEYQKPAEDAE